MLRKKSVWINQNQILMTDFPRIISMMKIYGCIKLMPSMAVAQCSINLWFNFGFQLKMTNVFTDCMSYLIQYDINHSFYLHPNISIRAWKFTKYYFCCYFDRNLCRLYPNECQYHLNVFVYTQRDLINSANGAKFFKYFRILCVCNANILLEFSECEMVCIVHKIGNAFQY